MAANALVLPRVYATVEEGGAAVLATMGLTVSNAVLSILSCVAREKALPFESTPAWAANKETREGASFTKARRAPQ